MADITYDRPSAYPVTGLDAASPVLARFSWRATFAGVAVALAVQILLTVLGLALGVTTMASSDSAAVTRGAGIGMGIWSLASTLISVFVGGLVAGISARDLSKYGGIVVGLVVWATTMILMAWMVSRGVAQAVQAAASTAQQVDPNTMPMDPDALGRMLPNANSPEMQQTARRVGTASAAGLWIAFATLTLSGLTGILGGILGARMNQRRVDRLRPAVAARTPYTPPAAPTTYPSDMAPQP